MLPDGPAIAGFRMRIALFILALGAVGITIDRMQARARLKDVDPETLLAARFAKGEIDDGEYARRLSILRLGPPLELPD